MHHTTTSWFRSTRPSREQLLCRARIEKRTAVSTHAPTRGATRYPSPRLFDARRFYPRSHAESDPCARLRLFRSPRFDPRSHAESDASSSSPAAPAWGFDPRSHAESDDRPVAESRGEPRFDPRSHAESDVPAQGLDQGPGEFRSTLPRGERQVVRPFALEVSLFRSTLPRGERQKNVNGTWYTVGFRSTLPRGERRSTARSRTGLPSFDPHSHAESDIDRQGNSLTLQCFDPHSHAESDDGAMLARPWHLSFRSTLPRGERLPPDKPLFILTKSIHEREPVTATARASGRSGPAGVHHQYFQ